MSTFFVKVDYATLIGPSAIEKAGKIIFNPKFLGSTWTTDGTRIVDSLPSSFDITSTGAEQTFELAHPEGWLIPFEWEVTVTIETRNVIGPSRMITPEPGSTTLLPSLLAIPLIPTPGVTIQTLVVADDVTDGFLLYRDGPAVRGIDPDTLGGAGSVILPEFQVTTLPAGSPATVTTVTTSPYVVELGLPQGDPGAPGDSPSITTAALDTPGWLQAVFITAGGTIPAGTPAWSLIVEVDS